MEEAEYLSHWFGGGDIPFDGVLSGTTEVPSVAEMMVEGDTVREELLFYGVHKVVVPMLLCPRGGLEIYKVGDHVRCLML